MGQVNLYKIDENKRIGFLDQLREKFEFVGEQNYNLLDDEKNTFTVGTYVYFPDEKRIPEWRWILDEYECEFEGTVGAPRAILVIENRGITYAVTYGFHILQLINIVTLILHLILQGELFLNK